MTKLLRGPFYIAGWQDVPWDEYNVNSHMEWCPSLKETTLTLFTKDHQKVVKLKDSEYLELSNMEQNNWTLMRKNEWQLELKALYQNMGD